MRCIDVFFWGVLYSAFFVSMMEWGSRILTPHRMIPHELTTGCTYCGVYFVSHTECFVFCFESWVYSVGFCGVTYWGVCILGVYFSASRIWGLFWGPVLGVCSGGPF